MEDDVNDPEITEQQKYEVTRDRLLTAAIIQTATGITRVLALTRGLEFMNSPTGTNQTFNLTCAVMQAMGVELDQLDTALMDYALDPLEMWGPHKGVFLPVKPGEKEKGEEK